MKVSKSALSTARRLFRLCQTDGRLDEEKLRLATSRLAAEKPRDYRGVLHTLKRLVQAELQARQVTVESATALDAATAERLSRSLRKKYGEDLQFDFKVSPDLVGGMRVRVGNDVFDGSLKSRLERLANSF